MPPLINLSTVRRWMCEIHNLVSADTSRMPGDWKETVKRFFSVRKTHERLAKCYPNKAAGNFLSAATARTHAHTHSQVPTTLNTHSRSKGGHRCSSSVNERMKKSLKTWTEHLQEREDANTRVVGDKGAAGVKTLKFGSCRTVLNGLNYPLQIFSLLQGCWQVLSPTCFPMYFVWW